LDGTNTYSGKTSIHAGILSINTILSVSGGNSAVGAPTTIPNGTIAIGNLTTTAQLTYTGAAQTTDRVIDLAGTTGGATIDQSGTGLLKFTSSFTATGAGAKTLTLQGAGTGEIGGAIVNYDGSNPTGLTKAGTGTWTLSGTSTYTGTTTISGGTLQLGNSGTGGALSSSSSIVNNGNLTFNRSDTLTQGQANNFASVIAGSGSVTQAGGGTTVLLGSNTYDGITTIRAGVLSVGTLVDGGITSSIGDSSNAATNLVFDGGTLQYTGNTTSTDRGLTINTSKIGVIEVSTAGQKLTISGATAATNGALSKTGSGILALTGSNLHTGGVTAYAGTLVVNNTVGSGTGSGLVRIESPATLSGRGIIGGDLVVAGTHSPGNSAGVQTVDGDADYLSSSFFNWELSTNTTTQGSGTVGSPYVYDQVLVGGAMTVADGAVLNIVLKTSTNSNSLASNVLFSDPFWNVPRQWPVFVGATSYTGTFSINVSLDTADQPYTSAIQMPSDGFYYSAGNLYWNPVPEPTSALAGLLLTAGLLRRRRTQVVSQ
jgi:fibronectin-binding autotransporter adhesin